MWSSSAGRLSVSLRRLLAVVIIFVAACSSPTDPGSAGRSAAPTSSPAAPTSSPAFPPAGGVDIPALVRRVEPSVVTVLTERGQGSGIVYRADGTVVTNAHVVADAQDVKIALADGQQVPAKVRAADEVADVAIIQTNRNGLPAAKFQETLPKVGAVAIVLGSPLGFEATVTSGIISGYTARSRGRRPPAHRWST